MIQIPFYKFWNTWSAQSPASMKFLPASFIAKIGAYSCSAQKYTPFPFSRDIKLFEHHPNGDYCRLEATHAGTVLGIEYLKPDPWTVMGKIKVLKSGEWGLRFWVLLSLGFEGDSGGQMTLCSDSAKGEKRSYVFAAKTLQRPTRLALIDDDSEAGKAMERFGYYAPEPQTNSTTGRFALFKYNLEQTPEICFAVSTATFYEEAEKRADSALALFPRFEALKEEKMAGLASEKGALSGSVEAVRDVMAWNSIEDVKNSRVFTSLTRYWIDRKFGGWFVWQDDLFYHALLCAFSGDFVMAKKNLLAVMDSITPDGNLACLMSEYTEWVDRAQPPIEAFIIYKYCAVTGDTQILEAAYPLLKTTYDWWFKSRDGNGNGVLEYGSSPGGRGHFARTKLAAKDESAMDNSPMYDGADFLDSASTLNMEDIALNSLLALDGEILSDMAKKLGKENESAELAERNDAFKKRIDQTLWDENRGIYANRHWKKGFAPCSPTSFYALAAGIPEDEKAKKLAAHIFDKNEFWSGAPLPSISLSEPSSGDNVYWRGRMWPPLNFFTYVGLKRYRMDKEAYRLSRRGMEIFSVRFKDERACYENYNAETGLGGDSVDADPFYGWGALLPLMWLLEHIDIDPWNGFHFGDVMGENYEAENLKLRGGVFSLLCKDGVTQLIKNSKVIFVSDARGRFRNFVYGGHYASVEIASQEKPCFVQFPTAKPLRAAINGKAAAVSDKIKIDTGKNVKIELWY